MTTMDRYRWQDEFIQRYNALNKKDFTLIACPGAGKTRGTLRLAKELIETGVIDFLWIVCPTRQVKKQWALAARKLGIDIEHEWEHVDAAIPEDMMGAAVTYGAVTSAPALHQFHVGRHRTLVIFDEIHHADEDKAWGTASQEAFSGATKRLMLSGTPFRRKGVIPFVQYDTDSEGKQYVHPDFEYLLTRAQTDGVCRFIYFPKMGGEQEWEWNDEFRHHSFDEELTDNLARQRLAAAIHADLTDISETAKQILLDADRKISEIRNDGDTAAAGLVIAKGKDSKSGIRHATAIADHMERLLGDRPTIVIGDDPAAQRKIDSFREGTQRWLVSINMISEGVDIPRLRVLAYLTNVTSEVYFDQAAGRICRGEGDAHFFIPDDDLLVRYAQRLAESRKAALREVESRELIEVERTTPETNLFRPMAGTAERAGVIFGSYRIDRTEYDEAQAELEKVWPGKPSHEDIGRFAVARRRQNSPARPDEPTGGLLSERKERLRNDQNTLVRQYCYRTGKEYAVVNGWLNQQVGVHKIKNATEEQLIQRFKLIRELNDQ